MFPKSFSIPVLRGEFAVNHCVLMGPEQVTKYLLPISLDENGTVQTVSMVLCVYVLPVTRFFFKGFFFFVFFLLFCLFGVFLFGFLLLSFFFFDKA